jgi:hypothetical protein
MKTAILRRYRLPLVAHSATKICAKDKATEEVNLLTRGCEMGPNIAVGTAIYRKCREADSWTKESERGVGLLTDSGWWQRV